MIMSTKKRKEKFCKEAIEAANAANKITTMSSGADKEALVEVVEFYFCHSNREDGSETESDGSEAGDSQLHSRGLTDLFSEEEEEDSLVGDEGFSGEGDWNGMQVAEGGGADGRIGVEDTTGFSSEVDGVSEVVGGAQDSTVSEDLDTEEIVQEAMQRIPEGAEVPFELRPCDITEDQKVEEFMRRRCSCTKFSGSPCSQQFEVDYIKKTRLSFRDLEHDALDMFIMGQLVATSCDGATTTSNKKTPHERKRTYTAFYHQGKVICQEMFLFIHGVSSKRLKAIRKALAQDGIAPRRHGNTKRLPINTLSMKSTEYVVRFLLNYTEQHGLLLPGRVPGYSRDDIKLLPSSTSKFRIHKIYLEAAEKDESVHAVSYSKFTELWRTLLPSIILMKPMTDLCWTCQQNSNLVLRSANNPSGTKSKVLEEYQEHLRIVGIERSYYKTTCDDCKREIKAHFTKDGVFQPPPPASRVQPNSKDIAVHYSFDYAQQVHYPSDPLQPGPVYFLTARKCSVFGVNCEAIPRQVNFLTDEAGNCGKGANTVLSQLHYFFEHHGLGEKKVFLHADNCTGQNKNNAMLHYLSWRVMTGKHTQITLSFLVVGHTKFSPDWCFGLFKRLYRRTKVGSLKTTAKVVNESAECNVAQLVAAEDGTTIVPTYNWTDLFAPYFKNFDGLKKYHHFSFDSSRPGELVAKIHSDSKEKKTLNLLKQSWIPTPTELPPQVTPKGLSPERQWYLYDKIREFCPEEDRDITCPMPAVPKATTSSRAGTPANEEAEDDNQPADNDNQPADEDNPPPAKKRCCRICKKQGHNSRTCPDKVNRLEQCVLSSQESLLQCVLSSQESLLGWRAQL